jgi:phosphoribosylformylglycinamidine synthase
VFSRAGLDIVQFGDNTGELGGSEYLKTVHGLVRGTPPALDLTRAGALNGLLVTLVAQGLVQSAHDCAEGGLAVTLAECCFDSGSVGADVDIPAVAVQPGVDQVAATLFGESASCVLLSVRDTDLETVLAAARGAGVPAARIGRTGGDRIRVRVDGMVAIDCARADAETRWATSLAGWMDGTAV